MAELCLADILIEDDLEDKMSGKIVLEASLFVFTGSKSEDESCRILASLISSADYVPMTSKNYMMNYLFVYNLCDERYVWIENNI